MKKLNLIIGKKQIIISTLVLILGAAVYLNWQFAAGDQAITVMDVLKPSENTNSESEPKNYGEAQLISNEATVNKLPETNKDNIKNAALEKEKAHTAKKLELQEIVDSTTSSEDDKANANAAKISLAATIEKEKLIEAQINSLDYIEGSVVYLEADKAHAMIKLKDDENKNGTTSQDDGTEQSKKAGKIAKIKEIIQRETGLQAPNIVITPVQ